MNPRAWFTQTALGLARWQWTLMAVVGMVLGMALHASGVTQSVDNAYFDAWHRQTGVRKAPMPDGWPELQSHLAATTNRLIQERVLDLAALVVEQLDAVEEEHLRPAARLTVVGRRRVNARREIGAGNTHFSILQELTTSANED